MGYQKRGNNSYRFQCQICGERFQKTVHFYNATKKDIEKQFNDWKRSCENGDCSADITFNELANIWLNEHCLSTFSPLVVRTYKSYLDNWILPYFGHYKLDKITSFMFQRFIEKLKSSNTICQCRQPKLLSNGTIKKIYVITKSIFKYAYRADMLQKDISSKVKFEKRKELFEPKIHYWNIEEYNKALALLKHTDEGKRLVIEMALKTGLRRSELFGLTWEDWDDNSIYVNKSRQKVNGKMVVLPCKTEMSIRRISISPLLVEALKEYHKKNMDTTYIFEKIDYDSITAWFREWCVKANLPKIKYHDLRHTHATLLLSQHIDVKTIQKRLGHKNISTTLDTYSHVLDELDLEATNALEKISLK